MSRLSRAAVPVAAVMMSAAACSPAPPPFSEARARAHVEMLAGTIGNRPIGTEPNSRARAYIMTQLDAAGFSVEVREGEARRPEIGQTARVRNIIARRPGQRAEAIALVSHYDSAANSPGAADAALGVAVCLETARQLALRPKPVYSLFVIITDGEEIGLMGAAAIERQTDVMSRLAVFVNFEAIGSAGPSVLFEAGPGNAWLLGPWRTDTPRPRGTSVATEIYRLLPNDTDFTILKRSGVPGLNFAPFGDSYAYHTPLDQPARLQSETLDQTGRNAVALVTALDRLDLMQRSEDAATFFDVAGIGAVAYGPGTRRLLILLSIAIGATAFVRVAVSSWRAFGFVTLLLTAWWVVLGIAAIAAAGTAVPYLLRASRQEIHPWYGHPERLFWCVLAFQGFAAWVLLRLVAFLPTKLQGTGETRAIWTVMLPAWLALAVAADARLPGASYLWTIPVTLAGSCLLALPPSHPAAARLVSSVMLGIVATLWIPTLRDLMSFLTPMFGRLPVVTPAFIFAALPSVAILMIGPPLAGVLRGWNGFASRRGPLGVALAVACASLFGFAWIAPAYTGQRPLRRYVRYIQDERSRTAFWEIGGNEPAAGLPASTAARSWSPARDAPPVRAPVAPFGHPFVVRATGLPVGPPPASVSAVLAKGVDRLELAVLVVSRTPGVRVSLLTAPDVAPLEANMPGIQGPERSWLATYAAPPPQGVTFEAAFRLADENAVRRSSVIVTTTALPGGTGWQGLPAWLPGGAVVWSGTAVYILPLPLAQDAALR